MTMADFQPIIQAIIAGLGVAITALIGVLVPRAIAAFEARTHIALTDQQRAAIRGAAVTQAGIVTTQLQQRVLSLSQVRPDSPEMLMAARAALARVPEATAAVGTTPQGMAALIVGAADTTAAVGTTPQGMAALIVGAADTTAAVGTTPQGMAALIVGAADTTATPTPASGGAIRPMVIAG